MATIRGCSPGRPPLDDAARGLEPVHLRHLHVHQHQVVGLAVQRLDRFDAVGRRRRRGIRASRATGWRASGSRCCPRRGGSGADGARRAPSSSLRRRAPARRRRPLRSDSREHVVERRRLDRLGRGRAANTGRRPRGSAARRRAAHRAGEHDRSSGARAVRAARSSAVHARHLHVEHRDVEPVAAPIIESALLARRRRPIRDAPCVERSAEDAPVRLVVVDHQPALGEQIADPAAAAVGVMSVAPAVEGEVERAPFARDA